MAFSIISVIVPVYNGQETIAQCLEALVGQESVELNVDYEVVVVDDGSTDNTVQVAGNYPVKIISLQNNRGRIVARKQARRQPVAIISFLWIRGSSLNQICSLRF